MPLFRSKAENKVREAGFDPARLPPGQYYTDKWPVLHAGEVPQVDLATWTLQVTGAVEEPLTLTFEPLRRALQGRALGRAGGTLPPEAERPLRDRPRRARLHRERPARRARGRRG